MSKRTFIETRFVDESQTLILKEYIDPINNTVLKKPKSICLAYCDKVEDGGKSVNIVVEKYISVSALPKDLREVVQKWSGEENV